VDRKAQALPVFALLFALTLITVSAALPALNVRVYAPKPYSVGLQSMYEHALLNALAYATQQYTPQRTGFTQPSSPSLVTAASTYWQSEVQAVNAVPRHEKHLNLTGTVSFAFSRLGGLVKRGEAVEASSSFTPELSWQPSASYKATLKLEGASYASGIVRLTVRLTHEYAFKAYPDASLKAYLKRGTAWVEVPLSVERRDQGLYAVEVNVGTVQQPDVILLSLDEHGLALWFRTNPASW